MILASLLSSSKYIIVNKDLIKILGLNESVILGELCSEYTYWENTNQLMDDGYFYSTRENIENNTGINAHYQRIAMKNLEQKGIISLKKMGIPCKIYYKINEEAVVEYLKMAKLPVVHEMNDKENISCNTSDSSGSQQEVDEVNGNNNNINNKKNNNKEHTHAPEPDEEKKEYATKVTMTKKEYQNLTDTYGEDMTKQLIEQLSLYKQAKGKNYESDYSAILYWVTERIRELEKKNANYNGFKDKNNKNTNNKNSYDQREYPPDFLNSLYCNK